MKSRNAYMTAIKLFVVAITLTFVSCSGDPKERTAEDALSALLNSNKNASVFGHVSVYNILNKADYKHIPKVSILIDSQMETFKKAFKLEAPIYFAACGPYKNDGSPETVYGFMDISSADSVLNVVHSLNYSTEKAGDFTYFQEGDVACGVRNKLFVIVIKGGELDGKAEIEKALKATEGDLSEGKPQDIITSKADMVVGVSLERLFAGANTSLNKLPKAKQDELNGLVADGYVQTSLSFNNGELKLETKNLFSEELKDQLFFKDNQGDKIVKKLGKGTPWMGVAANVDMNKLNKFMTAYSANGTKDLTKMVKGDMGMMMMIAGVDVTKDLSGQFGYIVTGKERIPGSPMEFNAYVGTGGNSKKINKFINGLLEGSTMKNGAYVLDKSALKVKPDGLYYYALSNEGKAPFKVPSFAKTFGQNTFSLFVNFNEIDYEKMQVPAEFQFLKLMESATIDYTRDGGTAVLTAKDKSKNILDQMTDFYYNMYQDELSNFM